MKYIIGLFLIFSFQIQTENLLRSDLPTIYFITQSPVSSYYGDPASATLAKAFPDHQIFANYLKFDVDETDANRKLILDSAIKDIRSKKPAFVFAFNSGISKELKSELKGEFVIADFSLENSAHGIELEDPAVKLVQVLSEFEYDYENIYLLTDKTYQSKRIVDMLVLLLGKHVEKSRLKVVSVSSIRDLETKLRSFNGLSQSVILNYMFMLSDEEHNKTSYVEEIKQVLTRVNTKHLDVGSYTGAYSNECVIIQIDYQAAIPYMQSVMGKKKYSGSKKIPLLVKVNVGRMDKLGLSKNYVKGVTLVDATINDG